VLNDARRGVGVKAEARPPGGSSNAQSLDAGEHRTTINLATAGMAHSATSVFSARIELMWKHRGT
jgi:hypothetical protein